MNSLLQKGHCNRAGYREGEQNQFGGSGRKREGKGHWCRREEITGERCGMWVWFC